MVLLRDEFRDRLSEVDLNDANMLLVRFNLNTPKYEPSNFFLHY